MTADEDDLSFAFRLADAADAISSAYVGRGPVAFEAKADGSPVTAVDGEVEAALADLVRRHRPADGFLGEETGTFGSASTRWIVDGIDGTDAFAAGGTQWATLVAYERDGEVLAGVVTSPANGWRWWAARGAGAWRGRIGAPPAEARRLHVSTPSATPTTVRAQLDPAVERNEGWRHDVAVLVEARFGRPEARGYGPLLALAGALEVSVHLWGGAWDPAPFAVLIEEAGGRFADLWGGRRLDTTTALFGTSEAVADVLDLIEAEGARGEGPTPTGR